MTKHQIDSREDWLMAAIAELRPMFKMRGFSLPEKIRVSVGFPGSGQRPRNSQEPQCYAAINGKDGAYELFVSPFLDDEVKVLGQLTHNLIHAAVGIKSGHRAPFQNCAAAMGLEPPWIATHEGSAFKIGVARPVLANMPGPYPHARMSMADLTSAPKKQGTRLIKCQCNTCGYTTRTTTKWIITSGAPKCPTPTCKNASMECEV
jgi:hypothetical protein